MERLSVFTGGVSLMILGLGLMLRVLALRRRMPPETFGLLILLGGAALLALGIVETSVLTIIIAVVSVVVGASMAAPFVVGGVEGRPDVIDRLLSAPTLAQSGAAAPAASTLPTSFATRTIVTARRHVGT